MHRHRLAFVILFGTLLPIAPAAAQRSYGNDALPSAEVIAFQRTDARLRYRNARIEHDARGCAMYQGIAPNGQVRRTLLRNRAGQRICSRR